MFMDFNIRSFAAGAVVVVLGFYAYHSLGNPGMLTSSEMATKPELTERNKSGEIKFACTGYKSVYLREERDILNGNEVLDIVAESNTSTDSSTLVVNESHKYLGMLTSASVSVGADEPYLYTNFESQNSQIIASERVGLRNETLLFDKENGQLIWSKTGYFGPVIGASAQAVYFVCTRT